MELTDLNLLLKLLFSHLIVDFILQTNKIVRKKREGKYQYHIIHSLTQALVTYIVAGLWNCWFIIPIIFITHFAIDLWKITQKEKLYSFIIDQVLHILVLAFYSSGKCYLVLSYPRNSQTYPLLLSERRDFRHENKIKLQDYSHFDQYITSGAVVLAGILAERIV